MLMLNTVALIIITIWNHNFIIANLCIFDRTVWSSL